MLHVSGTESPLMRGEKQPLGGAVVVTVDSGTVGRLDVEVLWAHTTDSMCLGYMSTADQQAKVCGFIFISPPENDSFRKDLCFTADVFFPSMRSPRCVGRPA